jgi:hypothetical protein
MKTLYNRLETLRNAGKSGVVGFCGDINDRDGLYYFVYFHSLDYVFVKMDMDESSYFSVESENLLQRSLRSFSEIAQDRTESEYAQFDSICLQSIYGDLLWHMAHEMNIDNHTYENSETWEIPCLLDDYDDFYSFTLGFAADLESDALGFYENSCMGTIFQVSGQGFYVSHDSDAQGDMWTLYYAYPEPFVDNETGEIFIVQRLLRIISCDNWRSLYAASRAIIYNHLSTLEPRALLD